MSDADVLELFKTRESQSFADISKYVLDKMKETRCKDVTYCALLETVIFLEQMLRDDYCWTDKHFHIVQSTAIQQRGAHDAAYQEKIQWTGIEK
jgi:hypothetical protein